MSDEACPPEPERILAHRLRRSQLQFLVQWKSLPQIEASWLRASDLQSHPSLIESYFKSSPKPRTETPPWWVESARGRAASLEADYPLSETTVYEPSTLEDQPPKSAATVWVHPQPIPLLNPFVAVTGAVAVGQTKHFTVARRDGSTVYLDRDTLARSHPAILLEYLESLIGGDERAGGKAGG
jgi:hypothetical protein